jgi:hypothetical protein
MSELSIVELESEHVELLPERETLFLNTFIGVQVNQHAFAVAAMGHTNVAVAANVVVIGYPCRCTEYACRGNCPLGGPRQAFSKGKQTAGHNHRGR